MRALLQLLAAVITIAILWGMATALRAQSDQFIYGFGCGVVGLAALLLAYRRFVGPLT